MVVAVAILSGLQRRLIHDDSSSALVANKFGRRSAEVDDDNWFWGAFVDQDRLVREMSPCSSGAASSSPVDDRNRTVGKRRG